MASSFNYSPFCIQKLCARYHRCPPYENVFSRIYNKNNIHCQHLSPIMAQRIIMQAQFFHADIQNDIDDSSFQTWFIDGYFRDDSNLSHTFIPKAFIKFMCKSKEFQRFIVYAIVRVMCRIIKGYGLRPNCIADTLVSWRIIEIAQSQFIDNYESYYISDDNFKSVNLWKVEKKNEKLDTNFVLLFEKELNVKVDVQAINILDDKSHDNMILSIRERIKNKNKELVYWDHPLLINSLLIKSLKLNNIHPSQWFHPYKQQHVFDFVWNKYDIKQVKPRKRCFICYKRKNKKKSRKLRRCSRCKQPGLYYCSKQCQKVHWNKKHRNFCRSDYDEYVKSLLKLNKKTSLPL